jgi:hypothetical protein
MMHNQQQILTNLRDLFDRWETFLNSLRDAQITTPRVFGDWSIKDVVAHLRAWQQRSIARLEAALNHQDPDFPKWPTEFDPDDEDVDSINAWIYEQHRDQAWASVYQEWHNGFLRFLELGAAIPEKDLMEVGKYAWLPDYPLAAVLTGSGEHHEEHLEPLLEWHSQQGS